MKTIKLLRPHQYIKNIFVFAPLFFIGKVGNIDFLLPTILAFLSFCLAASAVYILNDFRDAESDRAHPIKKFRPIASGDVSINLAFVVMGSLLLAAEILALSASFDTFMVINLYVIMNIAYCFGLKLVALVDVTVIAIGFVLRLFAGSTAADITLSAWIVVMTFLLALFLALAKRRDDILIYEDTGSILRKVVKDYNLKFLDSAISIMAAVIIVAYISYTTSTEVLERLNSETLYFSTFFVILGLLRYLQLTLVFNDSGSPTRLALRDRFLQAVIAGWLLFFTYTIYL